MSIYAFIFVLTGVFLADISFSIWYVPKKPKGDYWKVIIWLIAGAITVYFGVKVVNEWWMLIYLLPTPLLIYWQLKDSFLGYYWHKNIFYLSKHWPDCYFAEGDGKWKMVIILMAAFVFSGLWVYL